MIITSIDIGSTWTKGAAFRMSSCGTLHLLAQASRPTSVNNLSDSFFEVYRTLEQSGASDQLFYSSSAKGGLSVAALGIVPEVTSEMARIAAYSAGAKLSQVYSYRLTRDDIVALEDAPPDILLFAGGTDGGHTDCVLYNAAAIAASTLTCPIVYAGNRSIQYEVTDLLSGRDVTCVENLLPALERPNPEPARLAMREVFLASIVSGKGLDIIVEATGEEPTPTPYAIYEYSEHIRAHVPGWEEFMLIDLGGATTDVYSCHQEQLVSGTVRRGLPEPLVKRTVEGDLGMRVSAVTTAIAGDDLIQGMLLQTGYANEAFRAHLDQVFKNPDTIPEDMAGRVFDDALAGTCVVNACSRHAGRIHQVSKTDGLVNVQTGRDLSGIRRVIGSGGYLSRVEQFDPNPWLACLALDEQGKEILTPRNVRFYRDKHYLFPLLANVARGYPEAAAHAGIAQLNASTEAAARELTTHAL
ncbi:MAG: glutamate mutase L [Marinobacter sp.]|uniref:glutamate mutase L n=1 Tax=Marinobacter sp. TaxID=50741 RepID=UPI0034A0247B